MHGCKQHESRGKAAIDQVTRHLAVELGPHGIRCNAVKPTVVRTEMGKTAWPDGAPETQAGVKGRAEDEGVDVEVWAAFLLGKAFMPVIGGLELGFSLGLSG